MEQTAAQETNLEQAAQADANTLAGREGESTVDNMGSQPESQLSKKTIKAQKRQQKQFKAQIENYMTAMRKNNEKQRTELRRLARALGKDDFNVLKEICTVSVPEEKDADGVVTRPAEKRLNKNALIIEGKNLLVLKTEQRMLDGKRKKTTGSSSQRKALRSKIEFLNNRNVKTVATEEVTPA